MGYPEKAHVASLGARLPCNVERVGKQANRALRIPAKGGLSRACRGGLKAKPMRHEEAEAVLKRCRASARRAERKSHRSPYGTGRRTAVLKAMWLMRGQWGGVKAAVGCNGADRASMSWPWLGLATLIAHAWQDMKTSMLGSLGGVDRVVL